MGGYLDLLMQTIFCANSKKYTKQNGASIYSKFSLTQASEFQILKEILQLLESQSSVQIIANENNTNAIYYKIEIQSVLSNKLLLKYLNQYPNLGQKWFVVYFTITWLCRTKRAFN
jgi:hypothetical protein